MQFETETLRDSCFYGLDINPFYVRIHKISMQYNIAT